jgi:SAM-dependent methyltransferase
MDSAKFWSNDTPEYNKSTIYELNNKNVKQAWMNVLDDALGHKKHLQVLDAGSGTGFLSTLLASMGHCVTGVEQAPNMLKAAVENTASRKLFVEFVLGDVYNLHMIERDSLDALLSRYVVWTLDNPEKAFREWFKVLKPGGRLVIIDANWYRNLSRSRLLKVWRKVAWLLDFVIEGKKLRGRGVGETDFYNLPLSKVDRPEADVRMLESCDFRVLKIMPNIRLQVKGYLGYLQSGYWGPMFVITAEKPLL